MLNIAVPFPEILFSRDGKRLNLFSYALLVLLCCAFFIPGIVSMPPTDRDEASFAQASKQMIETGNYTDIRLQEKPRYNKPIGIYWLQSASVRLFNPQHPEEIWAYRVPSFIGATVAVLMTAALGALFFSPVVGLMAAAMLAGCVLLNVEARLAKTDAALLGCIVTAMYGLARAYIVPAPLPTPSSSPPRSYDVTESKTALERLVKTGRTGKKFFLRWRPAPVPFLFWTALAVGVLIKGPIIFMPLLGVLLWVGISDRKVSWLKSLRPLHGLAYALALVVPWFIAIFIQSDGAFVQQSAGNDMFAKIWQGQNRGMIPPGMHILALPILFFPFVLFFVLALPDIWRNRREPAVKFCLGWIVPMWIVFELSMTKLPHYVLPAYPAIALLSAKYLNDGLSAITGFKHRFPLTLIVGAWLVLGSVFAFLFSLVPYIADDRFVITQIAAGFALILAQGWTLILFLKHKIASLAVLTLGCLVFLSVTFGVTVPSLQHVWMTREIVDAVGAAWPCLKTQTVSVGYHEPSLAFMAGTDTIMAKSGIEAANALKNDSCRVIVIDDKNKQEFIDSFAKEKNKPQEAGKIEGLNSGRGRKTLLTVFVRPAP